MVKDSDVLDIYADDKPYRSMMERIRFPEEDGNVTYLSGAKYVDEMNLWPDGSTPSVWWMDFELMLPLRNSTTQRAYWTDVLFRYQVWRDTPSYWMTIAGDTARSPLPHLALKLDRFSRAAQPDHVASQAEYLLEKLDEKHANWSMKRIWPWGPTRCGWMSRTFVEVASCDWFFRGGQGL